MKRNNLLALWLVMVMIAVFVGGCTSRQDNAAFRLVAEKYNNAHEAQDSANYTRAMALYKACIATGASERYATDDSVKLLLPKAMVQLVNVYQSAGKPDACIAYFDSLRTEVSKHQPSRQHLVLAQEFRRDIYVLLAYSLSRTDAEKEATLVMDSALSMPLAYPSAERKFRDYAYAAAVYYCVPTCQDKTLKYGRLALDEIKLCQEKSGAQWLVALMAKLYQGQGEVGKAIAMCREGYELAATCRDTLGMANSKKELADYLYQWKLYDDADRYISDAITLMEHTSNSNPMVQTVAYTIKAKTLEQQGKRQEALTYLDKAKKTSKGMPYNSGTSDVDLLMGKILVADTTKAGMVRFAAGMKLLEKVSHEATYKLRAQAFFELAKANILRGNESYGEALLDSMYAALPPHVSIEGAYDYALAHYLKTGNAAQVVRYSAAINRQEKEEGKAGTMKGVAKSLARFEMDKQENEMRMKLEAEEKRKKMAWAGIFLAFMALVGSGVSYVCKRRKMQRRHALTQQALSDAQMALAKTEEEKAKAEKQLRHIERQQMEQVKAGVSVKQLLAMKGDRKFKDCFNEAYPYFIANLRRKVPQLTNKEELYCMLIALNCTNEELAATFNVARSSVVVAKYRIRKKLNLAEGVAMEDYLASELDA